MNRDDVLAHCLGKPGAEPDEPWDGDTVAKVGGKIFAFTGETTVGVKCGRNRDEADELCARFPDAVSPMAYIGRYGWNTIRLDAGIADEEIEELIDASYDAVVSRLPKRHRPAASTGATTAAPTNRD